MINHISIGVHHPERAAKVIAELWNGSFFPFPPAPGSFFVLANDGRGTAVEVTPVNIVIEPGLGLPPETKDGENLGTDVKTEEYEAKFVESDFTPRYVATHLNINTHLSVEEVKAIGKREGWRTLVCNRGEGLFQLVEMWIEDRFMLEVMTPEQTARYIEITKPEFVAQAMRNLPVAAPPQQQAKPDIYADLIG